MTPASSTMSISREGGKRDLVPEEVQQMRDGGVSNNVPGVLKTLLKNGRMFSGERWCSDRSCMAEQSRIQHRHGYPEGGIYKAETSNGLETTAPSNLSQARSGLSATCRAAHSVAGR